MSYNDDRHFFWNILYLFVYIFLQEQVIKRRFWLKHRNDNYKNKIEITTKDDDEELSPSQAKIVRQALKLAKITKSKSIKNIH